RALHWLGPELAARDEVIDTLRRKLPAKVKNDLAKARAGMTAWAAAIAGRIHA
ncbi:MAG: hypothetical protein RL367_1065, partial [Pseudomonadota bacterium]